MHLKEISARGAQMFFNHSKFNSQHDWEDPCDHLTSTRTFTLIINKTFIRAPKYTRQMATWT